VIEHAAILVHEQNAKADQVEQGGEALTLVVAAQQVVLTQGLRPAQLRHRLEQRVFGLLARTDVLRRQTQPPFSLPFTFAAPGTTTPMRGTHTVRPSRVARRSSKSCGSPSAST
jgi:hypothetical protein